MTLFKMKNQFKFTGTALVTGSAKRVARTIILKLSRLRFNIALHYHNSKKDALQTAREIEQNGVECELFRCDLSNSKETSQLIKKVAKRFPDLNLLINSASIFDKSSIKDVRLELLDKNFNVHVKAPLILSREFAKVCSDGNIINMLDTQVTRNKTKYFAYLLTKKTLAELTKMLAVELGPNIRVNAIAPGYILPPVWQDDKKYLRQLKEKLPLKKQGNPEQIAMCVESLLRNPYLTGQILFNDGGEHLV